MVTTLSQQAATDLNNVLLNANEFGQSVTYKPKAGGSIAAKATVQALEPDRVEGVDSGPRWAHVIELCMSLDVIPVPVRGDELDWNGRTFKVESYVVHNFGSAAVIQAVTFEDERYTMATRLRETETAG